MNRSDILSLLYEAADSVNRMLPADKQLRKSADAPFIAPDSPLDSFAQVTFLVAVETRLSEQTGLDLTLAADVESRSAEFASLGALASLIDHELQAHGPHDC